MFSTFEHFEPECLYEIVFFSGGLEFKEDGNLVLYNTENKAVWGSGTSNTGANSLVIENDGYLRLYNIEGQLILQYPNQGLSESRDP